MNHIFFWLVVERKVPDLGVNEWKPFVDELFFLPSIDTGCKDKSGKCEDIMWVYIQAR